MTETELQSSVPHPSTTSKDKDEEEEEEKEGTNDENDEKVISGLLPNNKNKDNILTSKKDILNQQRNEIIQFIQSELREQVIPLTLGTLAMIGSTLANQALPKLLGKLLDHSTTVSSPASSTPCTTKSTMSGGTLMMVALGGGIASFVRTVLLNRAQEGIAARLRCKIISSLLIHRDLQFFSSMYTTMNNSNTDTASPPSSLVSSSSSSSSSKKTTEHMTTVATATATSSSSSATSSICTLSSPAAILSILQTDVASVSSAFTTTLANAFRSVCSTSFSTYHLISLHPPLRLQLSLFSLIPLFGISAITIHKRIKKLTVQQMNLQDAASTFAEERISYITTVHIHNRQIQDAYIYQSLQDKIVTIGKRVSFHKGIFMGFLFAGGATALASIFSLGGSIVKQGFMTHGDLTSFATYTFLLGLGSSGIMKSLHEMSNSMIAAHRIMTLIDTSSPSNSNIVSKKNTESTYPLLLPPAESTTSIPDPIIITESMDTLSLTNISFRYSNNLNSSDSWVLSNISLNISRGRIIALVGKNGCGKSTLAAILASLYEPCHGNISVLSSSSSHDHDTVVDVSTLGKGQRSKLVQYVPQSPTLFDMTVLDNVTYSNPTASMDHVLQALEDSNCIPFLSKLPNESSQSMEEKNGHPKYLDYVVGRNGRKLSGGQIQRIALARALICDPLLLILDEPTNHLDVEGQDAIMEAAVRLCRSNNKALLIITHNIRTLQVADSIVVLKDGKIVEQGTLDELLLMTNDNDEKSELCQLLQTDTWK